LWNCSAEELLRRAASVDPTPGGGSIAAVTAAFGFSLIQMAIGVTLAGEESDPAVRARLAEAHSRAQALQQETVAAVDRDVTEFDAVMAGYRMPRENDTERALRRRMIDDATAAATAGPLGLAEAAIAGIALVNEIEPLIKRSIVSDAEAGRDLLRGAALAALRTADINLLPLEEREHAAAPALRRRRDAAGSVLTGRPETA
jgi:formiminotetrahydrofolate cyclodeaminase